MAEGVEDQFPAVFVSLPFGNHLHIDAALNRSRNEQSAQLVPSLSGRLLSVTFQWGPAPFFPSRAVSHVRPTGVRSELF